MIYLLDYCLTYIGSEAKQVRRECVGPTENSELGRQGSIQIHSELSDKRFPPQLPSHSQLGQCSVHASRVSGEHKMFEVSHQTQRNLLSSKVKRLLQSRE